jgi:high affinity sulfate transporter 1
MKVERVAAHPQGFRRWVPGIPMLGTYRRSWLRFDLVAGVVLAAILVPQGMAYAELAGLPAVTGLYTTIACLIGYALFGPSRILVLGPDSSVAPLIFAAITPLLVTSDPATAIALAGMMAVLVGAIEVGLGLGKLGFVADLLSKEVQVGYMNGLAVTILVGQLPKLFGFSTDADGFIEECKAFAKGLDKTNTTALAIGIATLAVLLLVPRVSKKVPAVLVAVVGATVVTGVFTLAERGVDTVGALPQGLPAPTFPSVPLDTLGALLAAALGIVLVSLTDTIATSTSFAARRGDEVDPDQEMIGMGAANIFAGFFQGFAISASGSRTAVAEQSGSKSQVTGLGGAAIVALLLLFWPSLLQDLPQPALAAVVIAAALSLFNIAILRTYYRMRRSALVISLIASSGVILFGVLEGILIAIALSILLFFRRNWWPEGEVLGRVSELEGWHRTDLFPDAQETDRVLVFRWEAPLFFANAGIFRQEIRKLVRRRKPRWLVLQCEAITDIDVTAADMLDKLDKELNDGGVNVVFVEMRSRIRDLLERYGLFATFTREHVYPSIDMAMRGIEEEERRAPVADAAGSAGAPTDPPEV